MFAIVVGALAVAVVPQGAVAQPDVLSAKVVVIGVSGLRWSDVHASPELTALVNESHVGSISVKSATQQTCPLDGWLTISAGTRAWGSEPGQSCPAMPTIQNNQVPGWQEYVDRQVEQNTSAELGRLGAGASGICGFGPGAAVAVADRHGRVANWYPTFDPAALSGCSDAVVDGGIMPVREGRAEARAKVAEQVRQAKDAGGWVLLVGISEEQAGAYREPMVAMQSPPDTGPRWLTSGSTRRPGLIQLADLSATILLGGPPPGITLDGGEIHPTGELHTDAAAVIEDRLDTNQRFEQPRPMLTLVALSLVLLQVGGIVWFKLRRSRVSRGFLVGALMTQGGFFSAVFLATATNWWRFPEPALALYVAVIGIAAAITGISFAALGRNLAAGVALAAYLTLVVDGVLGTPMQVGSMFADGPVIGGRFYGFGNSTFAAFAVATLALSYAVGQRLLTRSRTYAAGAVLGIGLLAIIVEGVPGWGADFGGVIALTPAVLLLSWLTWRGSISLKAFLGLALTGFVAVTAFALADYARPAAERSHFGQFVARLLDGDTGDVFARKIKMALGPLHTVSGWIMLIAVVAGLLACVVPQKVPSATFREFVASRPLARPTLRAFALCGLIGMLLNDASITVPAIMIGFGLVLLVGHLIAISNHIDIPPENTRAQELQVQ